MTIIKVLKRKDGASLVVGVVIALIVSPFIAAITTRLSGALSGLEEGQYATTAFPDTGWQGSYLYPAVWMVLQLVVLELLTWLYVSASSAVKEK